MTPHWADAYIGEPWVAREHDCWAFFRRVYAEHFGIMVPEIDIDPHAPLIIRHEFARHDERKNWNEIDVPQEGAAVLMGKNRRPAHVGVWIGADGGKVLHCVEGAGVVAQSRPALRLAGWQVLGFYRRVNA